ncbi:hypothetical protein EV667_3720 [Ancylobacter aquaticus]|uniref:Uncharacterized protein n=1 Tax=Ancylobacter aquaticus TaxID=100 RepID=A0A4R1HMY7_ANCAQ|nr:DUF5993 family protein [Ancylobacter aquaticus]TCK23877.1 hypothetical protein EV667_3720 [Ancylobacter aquaticus]
MMGLPFFGFCVALAFAAMGRRALAVAAGLVSIGVLLALFKLHVTSALDIAL